MISPLSPPFPIRFVGLPDQNVKIPIALVSKKDGLLLADLARKFPDLEIGVKASLGGVETFNVELDFWLGVFDENSYRFLLDFEQILKRFGGRVSLNVVYKFFDYTALGEGVTSALCYSSGKYCVPEAHRTRSQALLDAGIRQTRPFDHPKSTRKTLASGFPSTVGRKHAGSSSPRSGCAQRIKASAPTTAPVRMFTLG